MNFSRSTSAVRQQQQPARIMNRQQQQSGSYDFQPGQVESGRSGKTDQTGQMGDRRHEGACDYQNSIETYLQTADRKSGKPTDKPKHVQLPATPAADTTATSVFTAI